MTRAGRCAVGIVAIADVLRLVGAIPLGLGDAEALYASYAEHLQGGYLDHPPSVGWLHAAVLAVWPSAFALRLAALALFTLSAWLLWRLTRALFEDEVAALVAVAALCVLPVFHLGGLAAAPDAVLAPLWLAGLLAVVPVALRPRGRDGDGDAIEPSWGVLLARSAAAGGLLGGAFLAKYSAIALAPVFVVVAWRLPPARRAAAIAAGAVAAAVVALPVIVWNAAHGFASLAHRFVWSQPEPGISLRNLGALIGGQLLYLSPVAAALLWWAAVRGWRERSAPSVRFALWAFWAPFGLLGGLCVWSRVAEPHWPVPAYFALLPLAGHVVAAGSRAVRRWAKAAAGVALGFDALVYVAVLAPVLPVLVPEPVYVARYDIVNELYGWGDVSAALRRRVPPGGVVVRGHYTMCAQLAWNLRGAGIPVVCWTRRPTDFDGWRSGPEATRSAPAVFVSDERFPVRPAACGFAPRPAEVVEVRRGGVVVRRFSLTPYDPGGISWPRGSTFARWAAVVRGGVVPEGCSEGASGSDYAAERGRR